MDGLTTNDILAASGDMCAGIFRLRRFPHRNSGVDLHGGLFVTYTHQDNSWAWT